MHQNLNYTTAVHLFYNDPSRFHQFVKGPDVGTMSMKLLNDLPAGIDTLGITCGGSSGPVDFSVSNSKRSISVARPLGDQQCSLTINQKASESVQNSRNLPMMFSSTVNNQVICMKGTGPGNRDLIFDVYQSANNRDC